MMGSKRAGLALVLGAAVAMAACKKSENYASDTGAAKADTGFAVGKAGCMKAGCAFHGSSMRPA